MGLRGPRAVVVVVDNDLDLVDGHYLVFQGLNRIRIELARRD